MSGKRYVCESCSGSGKRRVARNGDLGKPCPVCDGLGHVSEAQMEALLGGGERPNVLNWRIFARELKP